MQQKTNKEFVALLKEIHFGKKDWKQTIQKWRKHGASVASHDPKFVKICNAIANSIEEYLSHTDVLLTTLSYDKLDEIADDKEKVIEELNAKMGWVKINGNLL